MISLSAWVQPPLSLTITLTSLILCEVMKTSLVLKPNNLQEIYKQHKIKLATLRSFYFLAIVPYSKEQMFRRRDVSILR
jgi:hypothetical protein